MHPKIRRGANQARNAFMFRFRYPWVEAAGDIHVQTTCRFLVHNRRMTIRSQTGIGDHCLFHAETHIGHGVLVGSFVAFLNGDEHDISQVGRPISESPKPRRHTIIVDDDVWIGHGVILLAPTHIGRGAIVGAGSVVRGDVTPYSVVAGVPARTIRSRFDAEAAVVHDQMLRRRGWTQGASISGA